MYQIGRCLGVCVSALRHVSYEMEEWNHASMPQEKEVIKPLDESIHCGTEKLLA
jgi:hypothetical protein